MKVTEQIDALARWRRTPFQAGRARAFWRRRSCSASDRRFHGLGILGGMLIAVAN